MELLRLAYFDQYTKAAPLAVFRIVFGLLMVISMVRFWGNGWIEKLYLAPTLHFHYFGFEFIQVPGKWTYLLFILSGLSAFMVAIGLKYRASIVLFFLSFTYIELMDKTTYLNHYYFISVMSFIMIWLPAERYFSLDAKLKPALATQFIPRWNIDVIKLMLAIVYIYAGLAKLNDDWMVRAMPLTIWLPTKFDLPLLGAIMDEQWLHYLFSWAGALYDLSIVFLLLWKRTRIFAFVLVVFFHLLTRALFPIGMFPYIMIMSTLIFFSANWHDRLLTRISELFGLAKTYFDNGRTIRWRETQFGRIAVIMLSVFMAIQMVLPLRCMAYPGNLFWTEQGYRFSWRVMLMEKTGYASFKIVDGKSGKRFYVQNEDFLTAFQQKQMATQADFIVEYAHYLGNHFASQGHQNVEVYVESYASLNGRPSQPYIDPEVDLMKVRDSFKHRDYILPLDE